MKRHCWNGPSPLGHMPSWRSPWGVSAQGRGRGAPRRSTTALIPASGGAVRWGHGSERWPVRWGTQFGHRRRRRLTRGRCPWGRNSVGGERRWGAASGGGGGWLAARECGQDTGGHWGGVDGVRRWPEPATKHALAAEEWGGEKVWGGAEWEGIPTL
jgi:hypothetical protein